MATPAPPLPLAIATCRPACGLRGGSLADPFPSCPLPQQNTRSARARRTVPSSHTWSSNHRGLPTARCTDPPDERPTRNLGVNYHFHPRQRLSHQTETWQDGSSLPRRFSFLYPTFWPLKYILSPRTHSHACSPRDLGVCDDDRSRRQRGERHIPTGFDSDSAVSHGGACLSAGAVRGRPPCDCSARWGSWRRALAAQGTGKQNPTTYVFAGDTLQKQSLLLGNF